MFWFITYHNAKNETLTEFFNSVPQMFARLQVYKNTTGELPRALCIYHGDCVFDGS